MSDNSLFVGRKFRFGMATRNAFRYVVSRRISSSGKVLSEEEKAAENIYIKKLEQEKLQKLARKGPKADGAPTGSSGGTANVVSDANPSVQTSSTSKTSTGTYRNYAVVAGLAAIAAATGWYFLGSKKTKPEEVRD